MTHELAERGVPELMSEGERVSEPEPGDARRLPTLRLRGLGGGGRALRGERTMDGFAPRPPFEPRGQGLDRLPVDVSLVR